MEAIVFVGLQAAGKTTFYQRCFSDTHLRISLDMLRTRHRERLLVEACVAAKQPFVVDNTNPTVEERARYIGPARRAGFRVVGYLFEPDPPGSVRRNEKRSRSVPRVAIFGTLKRLERPAPEEGFDELCRVWIGEDGGFRVEEFRR